MIHFPKMSSIRRVLIYLCFIIPKRTKIIFVLFLNCSGIPYTFDSWLISWTISIFFFLPPTPKSYFVHLCCAMSPRKLTQALGTAGFWWIAQSEAPAGENRQDSGRQGFLGFFSIPYWPVPSLSTTMLGNTSSMAPTVCDLTMFRNHYFSFCPFRPISGHNFLCCKSLAVCLNPAHWFVTSLFIKLCLNKFEPLELNFAL